MPIREVYKSESENETEQCELRNSDYLAFYNLINNPQTDQDQDTGQVINANNPFSMENEVSMPQMDSIVNVDTESTTNITNL